MVKLKYSKSIEKSETINKKPRASLRRYTNLAATIHLLNTKSITLLNPNTWDDKNDAHYMNVYKNRERLSSVLAICFAQSSETYHHWRVFSGGVDGVCIEFDKELLIDAVDDVEGVRHGDVTYRLIKDMRVPGNLEVATLPFTKRWPYKDEREYRFVYSDPARKRNFVNLAIETEWIRRITLSPWMPAALRGSVIESLKAIHGCERIKVVRSTLVSNEEWISAADELMP